MFRFKSSLVAFGAFLVLVAPGRGVSYGQTVRPPADVNVVNSPTVSVGNLVDNPVLVRDVNQPRAVPFERVLEGIFHDGIAVASFQVPSGKRLVIKFITAQARVSANETVIGSFTAGGRKPGHHLVMTPQGLFGPAGNINVFTYSQLVDVSVEPSTLVEFEFISSAAENSSLFLVSVSGYLVDIQ